MIQAKTFKRKSYNWQLFSTLFSGAAGVGIGVIVGSFLGWV